MTYTQICSNLLKKLPEKQREVLVRRFGLDKANSERETLEAIGKDHNITRERVRQIERDAIVRLKPELDKYQKTLSGFEDYLKKSGGVKKEDLILEQFGGKAEQNQVQFLLQVSPGVQRFSETEDLYTSWASDASAAENAHKTVSIIEKNLQKIGEPTPLEKLTEKASVAQNQLVSFLEISKKIRQNKEGYYGLIDWPEINPRGVKDKAYLVFKKEGKPLHFNEVATLIGNALPQTVHNELIKDSRFVLVGRGLYALQEWGYETGCVKDIIVKVLKESSKPLSKEEILDKVMKQRFVKENTVALNLSNKKLFSRTEEGEYIVREA